MERKTYSLKVSLLVQTEHGVIKNSVTASSIVREGFLGAPLISFSRSEILRLPVMCKQARSTEVGSVGSRGPLTPAISL